MMNDIVTVTIHINGTSAKICVQATGEKTRSLVLSMFRKGIIDIPFMLFFHMNKNVIGIGWSTPIADFISFVAAICFFVPYWKKLNKKS